MYSENIKHFAAAMLAFGIMAAAVSPARADPPTTCSTVMNGGTINGNVVVSGSCTLFNVTVTGDVQVGPGAAFGLFGGKVGGNIQGNGCNIVSVQSGASVAGNVQIQSCASGGILSGTLGLVTIGGNFLCHDNGATCFVQFGKVEGNLQVYGNPGGGSIVRGTTIGGNLEFNDNTGATDPHFFGRVETNSVGGNVQVNGNSASEDVSFNTIGGNLSCTGNTGLTGGDNTVQGQEQGQCAGF